MSLVLRAGRCALAAPGKAALSDCASWYVETVGAAMMEAGSPGFAGPGVRGVLGAPGAPALQVRPGLLLGSAVAAEPGGLREAGVSAVLTVDSEEPAWAPGAAALGLRTLYVAVLDCSEADLLGQLDRCVAFLLQARAEGRTALVHW